VKKYLTATFLLLPICLYSQSEVPYNIKVQFMDDYISASASCWSKINQEYLVSFNHQSHFKKATYSHDGTQLLLETKLTSLAQVPRAVLKAVTKRTKSQLIDDIRQLETPNEVRFKFLTRKGEKIYALEFLQSGKLKSKIKIS
jgi:hypothetical protein